MNLYLISESNKRKYKIIYSGILAINILSFINMGSRGAILGMIFAILVIGITLVVKKSKKYISNKLFKILTISSIILTAMIVILISIYCIKMIDLKPIENAQTSNEVRLNLIYNGIHFLKQDLNFLLGIGSGNNIYYLENYSIYSINNTYNFHNFWLDILVEYGIIIFIGFLISYIIIFIQLYRETRNKNKNDYVFLFFWTAFAIACISSSSIITREWIWIAFATILEHINNNEKNKTEKI